MLDNYEGTVAGRNDEAARKGMLLIPQPALDDAVKRGNEILRKFEAANK